MSAIRATIVVPLYQDAASIESCLDSLLAQTCAVDLEIIVVDDGSRDGGDRLVEPYPVRLIRQKNGGPASARNRGATEATGPILLFLDSDCLVECDWAEKVVGHFDDPTLTAVLCPLAPRQDGVVPALVQSEIEERYDRLRNESRQIDFLAGAAFAVRTETFKRLRGFNEGFRYNEDVEFAYRLTEAGGRIAFPDVPRARHLHQTRWWELIRTKFWRGVWRIRLYRLFPQKRLADSWTPWSLKFQIIAMLLLPPVVVLGFVDSMFFAVAALFALAIPMSGFKLLAETSTALRKSAGWTAPFLAIGWLFARAGALAASLVFARLAPWQAPSAAGRQ
jgi:glycosyltransferase involved in cell wall biosynthesis